jgi:hypothetical protein
MTKTDVLTDYFRRMNDNVYDGGNMLFHSNYDTFQIMKGGAVTNTIKREKKMNRQHRLEQLNVAIRENKKAQVRLLYDVTFEQIDIEDDEGITNTQTQLDSELKRMEKERVKLREEIHNELKKKAERYEESKMNIDINMEVIKNKEESIQNKQKAYSDLTDIIEDMFHIRTKRIINETDIPASKINTIANNNNDLDLQIEELSDNEI